MRCVPRSSSSSTGRTSARTSRWVGDLRADTAAPALRRLLEFECERARALLVRGEPLVATLSGRARLAVAGFAAGGYAALDAIEAQDCDVLVRPPRTRRRDWLWRWLQILWRNRAR
jgi:phytoene/squalene synthetase